MLLEITDNKDLNIDTEMIQNVKDYNDKSPCRKQRKNEIGHNAEKVSMNTLDKEYRNRVSLIEIQIHNQTQI